MPGISRNPFDVQRATPAAISQARNSVSPQSAVSNLLGSAANFGQGLIGQAGDAIKGIAENVFTAKNFMSLLRGGGLPKFGMPGGIGFSDVSWKGTDNDDWRVRLSLPPGMGLEPNLAAALGKTTKNARVVNFAAGDQVGKAITPSVVLLERRIADAQLSAYATKKGAAIYIS